MISKINIAFVGAHSTGKTTLLHEFEKFFSGELFIIQEAARQLSTQGLKFGQGSNIMSFMHYINQYLVNEILASKISYKILISDRTILDAVAYAKVNKQNGNEDVPDIFIEMMENISYIESNFF